MTMEQVCRDSKLCAIILQCVHSEERLYWILNHSYQLGKPRQPIMRPSESAEVSDIKDPSDPSDSS